MAVGAVVGVVGGGPAGLIAAETLAAAGLRVVVVDQMASVGRKFLLAGRGGLNLTHTEPLESFLSRYRAEAPQLLRAVESFGPVEVRAWADGLGEKPFVGSSGRVFPASFRAAPLLRAWLARLQDLGVEFRTRHAWTDWPLVLTARDGAVTALEVEATVLALGGASWPRTGSDGCWTNRVDATELQPSNMGFTVAWSPTFAARFAGVPLKNVALSFGAETSRGDAMVTADGIEGGAVYALSSPLRDALFRHGVAEVRVDLRPDQSIDAVTSRLARRRPKESITTWLRGAGLGPVAISLLREATGNVIARDPATVAALIKDTPVLLTGAHPIGRAISTAGGVRFTDIDDRFMLRARPGVFVAGEMLDWDAPTGGYLLQGCFSTGVAAARGVLAWLESQRDT